jgi:hypothetical protein
MRTSLSRSATALTLALALGVPMGTALASSHREAPLISYDPLADNTDLYAFRSPDNPGTITIIANYIPFELPEGGPNYYSFGEGVRYEIHVDNNTTTPYDDIIYRFTFSKSNEDSTTFFNIRVGKQNLKTTYVAEKSTDGGATFTTIVANGTVPPPNIGPRSIESPVGLNTTYDALMEGAIANATGNGNERIFCGPVDDPFFVDLGGIFDLGAIRDTGGTGPLRARDGLAGFNCHTIALQIPISSLQKDGRSPDAANILDPDFVIGVWACAKRPRITTLSTTGGRPTYSDDYVQVSRLGMPLTNEAIIPIGSKDRWNSTTPHDRTAEESYEQFFINPELALYMDESQLGGAVPGLSKLRIQTSSLGAFDFRNGKAGLSGLTEAQRNGTAFAASAFGGFLLRSSAPRSVDILPIFYTGVPNLPPYQLATGKTAGPLSAGKPFINNFMPTLGDMLRLNMAVPPTPRNDPKFSSEGIIAAAALGLTDPAYNTSTAVQFIPNMDGFPNGRRLEDDVTRIELQAVGGAALAAIGLWYDDYSGGSPLTPQLLNVLGFTAGPTRNDVPLRSTFPYMAMPHRGYDYSKKLTTGTSRVDEEGSALNIAAPIGFFTGVNAPNPTATSTSLGFHLGTSGPVTIAVYSADGRQVATILDRIMPAGDHKAAWTPAANMPAGMYVATLTVDGRAVSSTKVNVIR